MVSLYMLLSFYTVVSFMPSCTMVSSCITILLFFILHSDKRIINFTLTKVLFCNPLLCSILFFFLPKIFKQGLFRHFQSRFFQTFLTKVLIPLIRPTKALITPVVPLEALILLARSAEVLI